jgi:hypothetical protein
MKARGRNGLFDVYQTDVVLTAGGLTTWVEVFSKRSGRTAPLVIQGNTEDVLAWAEDVAYRIKKDIDEKGGIMAREKFYQYKQEVLKEVGNENL